MGRGPSDPGGRSQVGGRDTESRATVHLVEPDAAARESLFSILHRWDCDVREYRSAEALLSELNGERRGCLVVDLRLPGMGGVALLRRLRSEDRLLPTIVLIERGNVREAVEAMRAGAAACLEKPYVQQILLRQIRRFLELPA